MLELPINVVVQENFIIKVSIDTQILAYLVDNSYPNLNNFIHLLGECPFVELVSSRFAIYEFVGIRKLEHYLRSIHEKANNADSSMNFSSVLRYKRNFNAAELPYDQVYEDVKLKVEKDLEKITNDYNITYEDNFIHRNIWKPHTDLVLSSRISKEDSLVLISSIYPDKFIQEDYLVFLTNDDQFFRAFKTNLRIDAGIVSTFVDNNLTEPHIFKIADINCQSGKSINLIVDNLTEDDIKKHINQFILEHIESKNQALFLGRTIKCTMNQEMRKKFLCFELDTILNRDIYISIVSSDLSIVYNHEVRLSEFWSHGVIKDYPYTSGDTPASREIVIELKDAEGNHLGEDLMKKLTAKGNLVFLHPDMEL